MSYFSRPEFECRCGCGFDDIDPNLVELLERARYESGTPFLITSGCRCEKHNAEVSGSPTSSHLTGEAVDISAGTSEKKLIIVKSLLDVGFVRIGIAKVFIHADISILKGHALWPY